MISLLGSKKAAFGPPGCTLVIKIQKKYKYKQAHIKIQNTKVQRPDDISLRKQKYKKTKYKNINTITKIQKYTV